MEHIKDKELIIRSGCILMLFLFHVPPPPILVPKFSGSRIPSSLVHQKQAHRLEPLVSLSSHDEDHASCTLGRWALCFLDSLCL